MKNATKTIILVVLALFLSINAYGQHSLQLDDGLGHVTTLLAGNPGGTLTLPSGNGVLVLSYTGTSSIAWLTTGNSGTNPPANPLAINLATNNFIGTTDNRELDFVTNGVVRARFKESTGDSTIIGLGHTGTAGAFEPGIGNIYSLGTLDRPWKGLYISPGTITFTASTGAHKPGDHTPTTTAANSGTLSFDTTTNEFVLNHPLNFGGAGAVTTSSVTITGLSSFAGGTLLKASPAGDIGLATSGVDFERPLTFKNGLTRLIDSVILGGALTHSVTFTGAGNVAFNEVGTFTIGALGSGLVKSTAGVLSISTAGTDYENPLTFSNGLTRTVNTVTLGGSLASNVTFTGSANVAFNEAGTFTIGSLATGIMKSTSGVLSNAVGGTDYEFPLTFSNGLTRSVNAITLGGSLASNVTFTGSANVAFNEAGTFSIGSLGNGLVKSTSGALSIATPGTDYENPLTFSNGLTRSVNAVSLGGSLASNVTFTGSANVAFSEAGTFTIASLTGGLVKSTAGVLSNAVGGTDYEFPLTFSNGLTRTGNAITLGGTLSSNVTLTGAGNVAYNETGTFTIASLIGGLVKSTSGVLSNAVGGTDYEFPLTFSNGLTRSGNAVTLGGVLSSDVTLTGTGNVAYNETGTFTIASLTGGLVKSTGGVLSNATGGTDYEFPLIFSNGLTRTANAITLGGALSSDVTLTGTGNVNFNETGDVNFNQTGSFKISSLSSELVKSTAGVLSNATGGVDYEYPLTFSNGLTRSGNGITLGGALSGNVSFSGTGNIDFSESGTFTIGSLTGGLVKSISGVLSNASGGSDYEFPLNFSNGLTRSGNGVTLGGALSGNVSFSGTGNVDFSESGSFTIGALGSGLVKSSSGLLSIATAGTDYQTPLTVGVDYQAPISAGDGISIATNTVSLGGSFANDVIINGNSKNFYLTSPGDFGIGTSSPTTGLLEVQSPSKTAFRALASGTTGNAGDFTISSTSNSSHALVVSTPGNGNALDATTSGNGWAGHFTGSADTSKGLYASAGNGQTGLQINNGSVILSHTNQATGAFTIGAGTNSVVAIDSGTVAGFNITLNTGTNGQIVYVFNGDTSGTVTFVSGTSALHPQNTGAATIGPGKTGILIYVTNIAGSGWITK